MPHPCVVCGRSRMNPNNRSEEYIFFGFPVNDEPRCKKWLEFCCREELYRLSKKQLLQRMVCSKHFTPSDFVNDFYDRLNNTAVPSIYDPKQSLYNIVCVLCGCFRKDPPDPDNNGATFHHFPGEEFRCLNWLDFVGVDSYYRLTRKEILFCYICSEHFNISQFVPGFRNRLIDSAVPDIKFPNEKVQVSLDLSLDLSDDIELFVTCKKDINKVTPLSPSILEGQACASCELTRTDPKCKIYKLKFHPFPAYEIGRCLKWCKFLDREDILKMTPNQIRKLVLCSGHFPIGQTFNNGGNSPCDAVPTIHNYDLSTIISCTENSDVDGEGSKIFRALVSSKKPKIDSENKPTPLAKKRGKSKRPTLINIPKPEIKLDNRVRKLPIPAASNWKLITNQFQPITITNNLVNNTSTGIKKVILPYTGNISNLGAPIPVDSLASIPPGLLIKIDLPDHNKKSVKPINKRTRGRGVKRVKIDTPVINSIDIQGVRVKTEIIQDNNTESIPQYDNVINCDEFTYHSSNQIESEIYTPRYDPLMNNFQKIKTDSITDNEELYEDQVHEEMVRKKTQSKLKMTSKCRKNLMPIQCELRRFLNKIGPYVRRLPKRSKAQVKLAIVNKVIDKL